MQDGVRSQPHSLEATVWYAKFGYIAPAHPMSGEPLLTELLAIPMSGAGSLDVYSGVARLSGALWASCHRPAARPATAVMIVHPSSNFLGHYALVPLADRGVTAVGMNTRYIANDSGLIVENCVLDLAAGVRHLRAIGYEKVVLVGNSGGGGLVALYQSQAEKATITCTPAGDPPDLTAYDLPPADAIVMLMAHPGRASTLTAWLDPAVVDESDPFVRDSSLDMFDEANGPPFSAEFISRYRAAQVARNRRITAWVRDQLERLDEQRHGASVGANDLPFAVHGTCADPRFIDTSLDPSDRQPGTLWGPPQAANFLPTTLGHFTGLRSWLSQWSLDETNLDGPRHLKHVSVPVLVISGSADQAAFPDDAQSLYDSVPHGHKRLVEIAGADHYFTDTPDLRDLAVDELIGWLHMEAML